MILQIYVYGPRENGWLDLPAGTAMEWEKFSSLFDEELSTSEFTLPFEVSWTDNNRRLLGFAERIENFSKPVNYFRCDIWNKGLLQYANAKLSLLEKSGRFSYTSGSFNASISGVKGLLGSVLKGKNLKDLSLGGCICFDEPSRVFAQQQMEGMFPQYWYVKFVPVAFENFFDTNRSDYDNEFLAKDTVNNLIVNGSTWLFGRPDSLSPGTEALEGDEEYIHYRTIPFFSLKYVFRKLFEENGFTVKGDFIDDPNFDELAIFNNYAVEKYTIDYLDINREIFPSNHMPDMEQAEFLQAILSWLKLKIDSTGVNEITLTYKYKSITQRKTADITEFVTGSFKSTLPGTENNDGYKIAYTWDSNDQFINDRIKDLKDLTFAATVQLKSELTALSIGRPLTTDDYAFVQSENMFYRCADATNPLALKWDAYSENLDVYTKDGGERSVEIPLSTLCQYAEFNTSSGLWEKRNYLGCRQQGSYINNRGNQVTAPFALRVFYAGIKPMNGTELPVSYNYNRYSNNTKFTPYSLALNGDDGIVQQFHKTFEDLNQNKEVVEIELLHTPQLDMLMEKNNTLIIKGIHFLVYKTEPRIPEDMTMKAFLVPL